VAERIRNEKSPENYKFYYEVFKLEIENVDETFNIEYFYLDEVIGEQIEPISEIGHTDYKRHITRVYYSQEVIS
jgi:hypothetical protein